MRKYRIDAHLSEAILDHIQDEVADMQLYRRLESDYMSNLCAMRVMSDMTYKDYVMYKEMFKKGYLAAHIEYEGDELFEEGE